jgi:hypothetical protein
MTIILRGTRGGLFLEDKLLSKTTILNHLSSKELLNHDEKFLLCFWCWLQLMKYLFPKTLVWKWVFSLFWSSGSELKIYFLDKLKSIRETVHSENEFFSIVSSKTILFYYTFLLPIIMLLGFMSRWSIPAWWMFLIIVS